jgi:hypothetical protein
MAYETTLLAPLFAALLSGCAGCWDVENVERNVILTPAEYAKLLSGKPTDGMTSGDPTTGATTGPWLERRMSTLAGRCSRRVSERRRCRRGWSR